MSNILEKKGKGKLDDTIPLKCLIESFVNVDDHTEFVLTVQRGENTDNSWKLQHRYNDFATLYASLTMNLSGTDLVLPPKKKFGNMDSTFLHERRMALQEFMDSVLSGFFSQNIAVKKFLDPSNYSDEIDRVAQQQAAMFFRSEPKWELQENLKDIGWRLRKNYFVVKSKDSAIKKKFLLSWVEHGPDMNLDYETTLLALLHLLTSLQHPYIYPVNYASCTDKGSTVVRSLHPTGSLRDLIFKTKPTLPFVKKYGIVKPRAGLEIADIQRIGRHILEALKLFRDVGWPFGHLHAGNVIVDGHQTWLFDIENGILGLPSVYRSYMMELKCVKNMESMNVYCFGHLLYEMTFGVWLKSATIVNIPENCPLPIKNILLSILNTKSTKSVLPSINDLLAQPFFNQVVIEPCKSSFKVSKFKDSLVQVQNSIETRLRDDQRKLRQFNRLTKARTNLLSEEEKKKRKKSSNKKASVTTSPTVNGESIGKQTTETTRTIGNVNTGTINGNVPRVQQNPTINSATGLTNSVTNSTPNGTASRPQQNVVNSSVSTVNSNPNLNSSASAGRGALLSSISTFGKGNLKKCKTNDRSAPIV